MTRRPAPETDLVLVLERELQTSACRRDPARLDALLDPDFVEIGASGRRWERDAIMAALLDDKDDVVIEVHDLTARPLTTELVQVFWTSAVGERRARRTSLWRWTSDGWRTVYHQGTPMPD